jgi:hypothetical protein
MPPMQSDIVTTYIDLRQKLINEKAQLEKRLQQITQVLEQAATPGRLPGPAPKRARRTVKKQAATPLAKSKRRLSPEGRRRIIEGTKARWAKLHAQKAAAPVKAVRRRVSKAARAKMAAAAKARWVQAKAAGKSTL